MERLDALGQGRPVQRPDHPESGLGSFLAVGPDGARQLEVDAPGREADEVEFDGLARIGAAHLETENRPVEGDRALWLRSVRCRAGISEGEVACLDGALDVPLAAAEGGGKAARGQADAVDQVGLGEDGGKGFRPVDAIPLGLEAACQAFGLREVEAAQGGGGDEAALGFAGEFGGEVDVSPAGGCELAEGGAQVGEVDGASEAPILDVKGSAGDLDRTDLEVLGGAGGGRIPLAGLVDGEPDFEPFEADGFDGDIAADGRRRRVEGMEADGEAVGLGKEGAGLGAVSRLDADALGQEAPVPGEPGGLDGDRAAQSGGEDLGHLVADDARWQEEWGRHDRQRGQKHEQDKEADGGPPRSAAPQWFGLRGGRRP